MGTWFPHAEPTDSVMFVSSKMLDFYCILCVMWDGNVSVHMLDYKFVDSLIMILMQAIVTMVFFQRGIALVDFYARLGFAKSLM